MNDFRYYMIHTLSVASGVLLALIVLFIFLWIITSKGFSSLKAEKKTEKEKDEEIPMDGFDDVE